MMSRRAIVFGAVASGASTAVTKAVMAAAEAPALDLPPPEHQGGKPLMEALMLRRSTRAYAPTALPPQLLSNLLWAANGVNRPSTGERTAPYWRHIMVTDIYAAMADGVWFYEPRLHKLQPYMQDDIRAGTGLQDFVGTAPLNLIYVAHGERMTDIGPEERRRYASVDAGFIGQNVYLYCASAGLATVFRGAVPYDDLGRKMQLPSEQFITFAQSLPSPRPSGFRRPLSRPTVDYDQTPLLTDLYQLNMLAAYLDHAMTETAAFELFVRKLPARRGFLMAAGLEQALCHLETLSFSDTDVAALRDLGSFPARLLDYLRGLRFTGDVDALPEGTVFFPNEPVLRIVAPLPEAQLVETRLINLVHFETVIASKAARLVLAADGKPLIDFGLRRAHGAEAGMLAARASYIAGFAGTATLAAGIEFGIPVKGTMAHSFIQVHDDETTAFEHFAHSRPRDLVLLIDTYDTARGARRVAKLASRLAADGIAVSGVRIDSGDLGKEAREVRRILDEAGLAHIAIVVSGGLDEDQVRALHDAPIDLFAVGTSLTTSSDAPALDCAYKLQEYAGVPRRKRSPGKATWPGRKQIWRSYDRDGKFAGDVVSLASERRDGTALLQPVMRNGRRIGPAPSLQQIRDLGGDQLARLPGTLQRLEPLEYPVKISQGLRRLAAELDRNDGKAMAAPP